ncbi:hypothetical protein, partial [Pasteurella multocida]|uniref:hypothetical protein n=1 Tax=Pasteurella multocida TaxID=747 RepID=UPI001B7D551C
MEKLSGDGLYVGTLVWHPNVGLEEHAERVTYVGKDHVRSLEPFNRKRHVRQNHRTDSLSFSNVD